jgi:hypothetical protein
MAKLNCWEVKSCGRQPSGVNVKQLRECPAATEKRLHGRNEGTNAGRACWVVAGTLCGGEVQGTFAAKMANCQQCEFFARVREEEGLNFSDHRELLARLRNN